MSWIIPGSSESAVQDARGLILTDPAVHTAFIIVMRTGATQETAVMVIQTMYNNGLEIRMRKEIP